ncbi:hypothetical protein [Blastococcus montanus]|uniref:hypothetical protein n=1 Tax=Blastococcus montanus TaxID=3144973 RepID=UPI00320BA69B
MTRASTCASSPGAAGVAAAATGAEGREPADDGAGATGDDEEPADDDGALEDDGADDEDGACDEDRAAGEPAAAPADGGSAGAGPVTAPVVGPVTRGGGPGATEAGGTEPPVDGGAAGCRPVPGPAVASGEVPGNAEVEDSCGDPADEPWADERDDEASRDTGGEPEVPDTTGTATSTAVITAVTTTAKARRRTRLPGRWKGSSPGRRTAARSRAGNGEPGGRWRMGILRKITICY